MTKVERTIEYTITDRRITATYTIGEDSFFVREREADGTYTTQTACFDLEVLESLITTLKSLQEKVEANHE